MTSDVPTFAFTTKAGRIIRCLKNQARISSGNNAMDVIALWDTGATGTCISSDVVSDLSLTPTGKKNIRTPSGSSEVNTYLVDITLPNNVRIPNVEVCDSEIGSQGIGMLVGMDIISIGDFAVSNFNGKTAFSFRIPSQKTTDYVSEINIKKITGTHGKGKRRK